MKLYTGEQVRNMLDTFILFTGNEDANDYIEYMTPIELPSDEEIGAVAHKINLRNEYFGEYAFYEGMQDGFIKGADWVRNQLINTKEK